MFSNSDVSQHAHLYSPPNRPSRLPRGLRVVLGHPPASPEAAVALLAGIAPGHNQRQCVVGRLSRWLSGPIEYAVGHRTLTHSLALQLAVLIPAFAFLSFGYAMALAAGMVSHSISDVVTEGRVCWWPPTARRRPGCLRTGTESEFSVSKVSFAKAVKRASLEDVHPHGLRRTCAGWLVQAGIGINRVSRLLRHRSDGKGLCTPVSR